MSHRTRIRADLAAWALNSAVNPDEFDKLDDANFSQIDGDRGGLWTPSTRIIIGGTNGLEMRSPFKSLGATGYNASMQAQNWPLRSSIACSAIPDSDVPMAWDNTSIVNYRYCALAYGPSNRSFTSEDGYTWVNRGDYSTVFAGNSAADIASGTVSGAQAFLATSAGSGKVAISTDGGASWSLAGDCGITKASIVYSIFHGLWVAAGNAGLVATSPDGATWTYRSTPANWVAGCGGVRRLAFNPSGPPTARYLALPLNSYNKVLVSGNLTSWTEATVTAATWKGAAYGTFDSLWMVASSVGDIWTSTDGLSWTNATPTNLYGAKDLAVNQSLWVSPTHHGFNNGVQWSVDKGVSWNRAAVGHLGPDGWARIIPADNGFLIALANGSSLEFAASLRSS